MSENNTNRFSLLTWVKSRWSPLTLVLTLSALLVSAIIIGALLQHRASSAANTHNHFAAQPGGSTASSSSASSGSAAGQSTTSAGTSPYGTVQDSTTSTSRSTEQSSASASVSKSADSSKAKATSTTSAAVIKTANLTLQSSHPKATASNLRDVTAAKGGYVQSMQTRQEQKTESVVNMTVRIPSEHFSSFLNSVKSAGTVQNFSQDGRNVTQQNNNFELRLNQLQRESTAYSRLYSKAKTMKDMLQIQQSLTQVNSEISSVKQQLQHLNQSVEFGTITIHIVPKATVTIIHQKPVWHPLLQSLHFMKTSFFALVTFLSWILPWGMLLGIILWFWAKWKQRQNGRNQSS